MGIYFLYSIKARLFMLLKKTETFSDEFVDVWLLPVTLVLPCLVDGRSGIEDVNFGVISNESFAK